MVEKKLVFKTPHGTLHAVYCDGGKDTPLIVMLNGNNDFYNFGMFPYIRQKLAEAGISSLAFNYTHSGIVGDSDFFDDLESMKRNSVSLRVADTAYILDQIQTDIFTAHKNHFLLGHSLGGAIISFIAEKPEYNELFDGFITLSCVRSINFFSADIIEQWKQEGVYYRKDSRTNLNLPHGPDFLAEILNAESESGFNVMRAIKTISKPVLMLHGDKDPIIPYESSVNLFACISDNHPLNRLQLIENGDHIFNAPHPFEGTTIQIETVLQEIREWIRRIGTTIAEISPDHRHEEIDFGKRQGREEW